ncbi:hypothetical protein SAMN04488505_102719 [Chitinophaga rupis]|uniref:Uncharacterized protein n=1 Tax=Chitinophaga rupis TaxID=573321 RepID=A0A1H7RSE1_9BACT|nr:hypothetical protein [Chitinophaga rupis]SEL63126.1 hypothetical protein SAMN04488505_102719 [Chitinophaga rupis]
MNFIKHLNTFFLYQQKEQRLSASHLSLYMALFQCWNYHRFQNPFVLDRDRLMQLSHIGSRSTYINCLRCLHRCGYIVYSPALHKGHKPRVSITHLEPPSPNMQLSFWKTDPPDAPMHKNEPVPGKPGPASGTDMGALLLKIGAHPGPNPGHNNKQFINSENSERGAHTQGNIPTRNEVLSWFTAASYPQIEAERFFSHYEANGWKQGGKTPITNWQAAAEKWMSYALELKIKPNTNHANNTNNHIHVQQQKNYGEPL